MLCSTLEFLVAKSLSWVARPDTTLFAVKLANRIVIHSSGVANSLVLSGVWPM